MYPVVDLYLSLPRMLALPASILLPLLLGSILPFWFPSVLPCSLSFGSCDPSFPVHPFYPRSCLCSFHHPVLSNVSFLLACRSFIAASFPNCIFAWLCLVHSLPRYSHDVFEDCTSSVYSSSIPLLLPLYPLSSSFSLRLTFCYPFCVYALFSLSLSSASFPYSSPSSFFPFLLSACVFLVISIFSFVQLSIIFFVICYPHFVHVFHIITPASSCPVL